MSASDLSIEEVERMLPAYRLEELVASGAAGAVYRGCQRSLDRPVTVKVLHADFARKPRFRDAFEREARATANLNHPNLLIIYEFGEIGGHLYLVSEYVHGKPLANSTRGRAVDPPQAVEIVSGICRGLAHLHEHGTLHRDLKPANILLTPDFQPKIGDFGLAHGSKRDADAESGYVAPELRHDPKAFSEASDLYAVGAILFEMLTGKTAAAGITPESLSLIPDPPLRVLVAQATHGSPAKRHRSARALAGELEAWAKGDKKPAAGRLKLAANGAETPSSRPAVAAGLPYSDDVDASKLGIKLAIIVVLSLLVVFLAWLLSDKRERVRQQEEQHRREQQARPAVGAVRDLAPR
jgi:serine/threonine protein kinase